MSEAFVGLLLILRKCLVQNANTNATCLKTVKTDTLHCFIFLWFGEVFYCCSTDENFANFKVY
jgi:hypothetical protein